MGRVRQWFEVGKSLGGWVKNATARARRMRALRSRHGNFLRAGRALQALANVTKDKATKVKAKADANYMFAKWRTRPRITRKRRR